MATQFDQSDFVDTDFRAAQKSPASAGGPFGGHVPGTSPSGRPPTREELDAKVTETQQRLLELQRAQEALQRERAALEEARRRQAEFQSGKEAMLTHLTRGIGILQEAEFTARRDAEQMAKTLGGFQDALTKVQDLKQELWTTENYQAELTRALTTIENARMEWNSALLKWPQLEQKAEASADPLPGNSRQPISLLEGLSFGQLSKLSLALTWPLLVVSLVSLGIILAVLLSR